MSVPAGVWCVASGHVTPQETRAWSAAARAGGAAAVTLRRPRMPARATAEAARALTRDHAWVALHGAADVAVAAGAQACIAGMRSLPVPALARAFGDLVAGASVHGAEEARRAAEAGARFLVLGPVWDTPSKRGLLAPLGPGVLARVCRTAGVPVIAIGGVQEPEQVARAVHAGAHGAAVLRAAREPQRLAALTAAWTAA